MGKVWMVTAAALFAVGCGTSSGDVEQLKQSQKDILAKLEGLEKSIQQIKAPPAPGQRPQIDPNNSAFALSTPGCKHPIAA